jgi:hypothetical protein
MSQNLPGYLTHFQFWKSLRIDLWGSYNIFLAMALKTVFSAFKEGQMGPNHSTSVIFGTKAFALSLFNTEYLFVLCQSLK